MKTNAGIPDMSKLPPIQPIPVPGTWQTKEHYSKVIAGLLESAETHLPSAAYCGLLSAVSDNLLLRLAQLSGCLPPQGASDLAAAAMKAMQALEPVTEHADVMVTWNGTRPLVTYPGDHGKPGACGAPEGGIYSDGEKQAWGEAIP